ncbi:MAG: alkaline phosphatase D family protein [Ilumatobacter sp.]|uniref:alkaline phosphatase D family protein n=1 Tax=Ilumatobacter sp. TaxID=1967498 RepID=UPI00329788D1
MHRSDQADPPPFTHGVASGDPTESSIVLWTAVPTEAWGDVEYTVGLDPDFATVVASGRIGPENHVGAVGQHEPEGPVRTVSIRVGGLAEHTVHHYRFQVDGVVSPVGQFATLPSADADIDHVRVGLATCARLASATFEPYADLARARPDLVVHLGDYIYEDGSAPHEPPAECRTDGDYRRRHAQYRREPALQELHRSAPWVAVWDDHDVADDSWRTGAADSDDGRHEWEQRRGAAEGAYFDWIPQEPSTTGPTPMDRRIRLGALADIVVLDARNAARDRPVRESGPALVSPTDDRRIISDEQWAWLEQCVDECPGWLVVCTQTQVSPLRLARLPNLRRRGRVEPLVNPGQWDGYPLEQERLARTLAPVAGRILLCSGDLHGRFHTGVRFADGRLAPEVTTPSIASTPFADAIRTKLPIPTTLLMRWLHRLNPQVSYMDLQSRGSTVLDITDESIRIAAIGPSGTRPRVWRLDRNDPEIRRAEPVPTAATGS